MEDESEISYEIIGNDNLTQVTLIITSDEAMSDNDYLASLRCFLDDLQKEVNEGKPIFKNENPDMH